MTTRIQLGSFGYLDTDDGVAVPLTFGVAAIQDISKRTGAFSKTIVLPGSANNRILLGQLFNVNITDSTFDVRRKQPCTILRNGAVVFEGYLQLNSVNKKSFSPNQDQIVTFEVSVKDDAGDFFTAMGDDTLDQLFSHLSGTSHTLTWPNIAATSVHTSANVYKYMMPYHQRTSYGVQDFNLTISAKAMWDAIFSRAGYSYQWPTMTGTGFNNLWIPYNGDQPERDQSTIDGFSFKAGFLSASTYLFDFVQPQLEDSITGFLAAQNNNAPAIIYNDETSTGFNDPGNQYNTTNGIFFSNQTGLCEFGTRLNFELYLNNPNGFAIRSNAWSGQSLDINIKLSHVHNFRLSNTSAPVDMATEICDWHSGQIDGSTPFVLQPGLNMLLSGQTEEIKNTFNLSNVSKVVNLLKAQYLLNGGFGINSPMQGGPVWRNDSTSVVLATSTYPTITVNVRKIADPNLVYFKNSPSRYLQEGSNVRLTDFLPKKVKSRDYISTICKMFNLYISPTDHDKVLRVETRDEFYDGGQIRDWTKKWDISQDSNVQFLPDIQSKKLLFTYKADSDDHNKRYTERTSEIYGQVEYTFDNDFQRDTKRNELIFSPTPITTNFFRLAVPAIEARAPKSNLRILYDAGWVATPSNTYWILTAATPTVMTGRTYPCMTHFDNPYTPSVDINYGWNDYLFYPSGATGWQYLTDNNLYNKYYRRMISQIESGKLLRGEFRLTEYDILSLDLRDKIFLDGAYYYLNRIIDWDANSNGLTTVELLSVEDGGRFTAKRTNASQKGTPVRQEDPPGWSDFITNRSGLGSSNNNVNGSFNIIQSGGRGNTLSGDGNMVSGTGNSLAGTGNSTSGSNNQITGNGNTLN